MPPAFILIIIILAASKGIIAPIFRPASKMEYRKNCVLLVGRKKRRKKLYHPNTIIILKLSKNTLNQAIQMKKMFGAKLSVWFRSFKSAGPFHNVRAPGS